MMQIDVIKRLSVGLLFVCLLTVAGCLDTNPIIPAGVVDSGDVASDTGGDDGQNQVKDSDQTAIEVISPEVDTGIYAGQPVLISWDIDNVPTNPTMDVLYRDASSSDGTSHAFVSDLPTSQVGAVQVDTSVLIPNHSYIVTLRLKSGGTEVLTQDAPGKIVVRGVALSVSTPSTDTSILPSESTTVYWNGAYLPAGSRLDVFFDVDRDGDNGNEIILSGKGQTLTNGGDLSGSIEITGQDIIDNADTDVSYFVGIRITKDTHRYIISYAPGTLRLYPGTGLIVLSPSSDTNVSWGATFTVSWSHNGVPDNLTLNVIIKDLADGSETSGPENLAVTLGQVDVDTDDLELNHQYEVILRAYDGANQVAEVSAPGKITIGTEGVNITFTNDELNQSSRKIYLGVGASYTINWQVSAAPADAKMRLFVSNDRNIETTDDQVEITPSGGVTSSDGSYDFSPSYDDFGALANRDFYLIAQLVSAGGDELAQQVSTAVIHIGDGSVNITQPTSDTTVYLGDTLTITWTILGDFCSRNVGLDKILRLYADEVAYYRQGTSIEITDVNGIDPCGGTSQYVLDTNKLTAGKTYYIIARLLVEGRSEEEHQAVASGKVIIPAVEFSVLTPETTVSPTELSSINVTWDISGVDLTGKKVRIYAEKEGSSVEDNPIISPVPPGDYDAGAGSGTADASGLPPGTYRIKCVLFDINDDGQEVIRATAYAPGKIVIGSGYNGTFDLSDMEAGDELNYSPLDGAIFEGFNISDQVGYDVAGLGDLDGDGFGDFLIFSRYGQEYTVGKAGSAYLIYGNSNIGGQPNQEGKLFKISLNSIPDILNPDPQIEGTILLFPMENLAWDDGGNITGEYVAMGMPDISGDGRGDLVLSAPEAAPLKLVIKNYSDETITYTGPYGDTRTIEGTNDPGNPTVQEEPMHVGLNFNITVRHDQWTYDDTKDNEINGSVEGTEELTFNFNGVDDATKGIYGYHIGNTVTIQFYKQTVSWVDPADPTQTVTYSRIITAKENHNHDNPTPIHEDEFAWTGTDDPPELDPTPLNTSRDKRGTVYYVTSNLLGEYRNSFCDLVKIGDPGENFSSVSDPASTMMLAMKEPDTSFGSSLCIIPDYTGDNRPELLIGSSDAMAIDVASESMTHRNNAGVIGVFDSYKRFTDIASNEGTIAWARIFQTESDWEEYREDISLLILGPEVNAHLSSAVSLGRFTSLNGRSEYVGGDFEGDGKPDFVVGAPGTNGNQGTIYIIYGRSIMGYRAPIVDLADFNQALPPDANPDLEVPVLGVKLDGVLAGQNLGDVLKAAGDFNGDGLADFVLAFPDDGAGKIIIIFGQENLIGNFTYNDIGTGTANQIKGLTFTGENAGDGFGSSVCAVYDFNGDGLDDILVSAPNAGASGKVGCGKVYVIYGKSNIFKTDYTSQEKYIDYDGDGSADSEISAGSLGDSLPGTQIVGARSGDHLQSVAFAGDVNNDGIGDILIGAPGADITDNTIQQDVGRAYLILGRRFDPWE